MTNFKIGFPDIPFNAAKTGTSLSATDSATNNSLNLNSGSRARYFELDTALGAGSDLIFNRSLASTGNESANFLAILRANLLQKSPCKSVWLQGCSSSYFVPSSVTGLQCWLDANRGLTIDSSNRISQWNDQSGNGRHATQSTDANKPTISVHTSGNNALNFDGINDYLTADSVASTITGTDKPYTIFIVAKPSILSAEEYIISFGNSGSNTQHTEMELTAGNAPNWAMRDDTGTSPAAKTGSAITVDTYIWTLKTTGTSATFYQNGSSIASGAFDVGATTLDRFTLGAFGRVAYTVFTTGQICEFLIYNAALSDADRQSVEAYLTAKWQTTPALNNQIFNTSTLYGPRQEDYITTFSDTLAYANWFTKYGGLGYGESSKYSHSKIYFGSLFDFGREPIYNLSLSSRLSRSSSRDSQIIINCKWEAIADAKCTELRSKILKNKDVNSVILYDPGDLVLNGYRMLNCRIVECVITPVSLNINNIDMIFEEEL